LYFVQVFCAPKITPKQPENDFRRHRHFFRTVAAIPYRHRRRRRCRSFLIVAATFGSSWVKKGDGGLGLRWWWLRV